MDCADIRQRFATEGAPSGSSVDEHLQRCAQCAELFRNQATLGLGLAAAAALSPPSIETQLAATEALLEREHGARAYLRSRSTRVRWTLSVALPALLLVRELLRGRVAWREFSTPKLLGGLLLVALFGVVTRSALRPLPLERRAARLLRVLALVAWCLPCLLWFAPETHASAEPFSAGSALGSLRCFAYGSALAMPSFALLWALDRGIRVSFWVWALGAGIVALLANLILLVHCPNNDSTHLLLGHFSIGLAWFGAISLGRWLPQRAP